MNTEDSLHVSCLLDDLESLSNQTVARLATMEDDDFTLFTEQRAQLVEALAPYREVMDNNHRARIGRILDDDKAILARMHAIKQEAEQWLAKRNTGKIQRNAYQQVYTADSLFFDKKK
ncbi:hypothetical protein [Paenibacillus illinoisensis]|uniref:hypothetical protein n=1 Tax=Paenibacillus illinoisensis TaxID=59845 RepID=UPI003D2A836F